ncbi:hypothetical protein B0A75_18115 [Flavobacterium oncorhynchi]|uniref:Uncharacterized protein n=1 Tax=Flavobacterium oncorhynchi TaxID=728056 RepID=A0A226HQQ9_9FLAO|nr:hypothetical protein [Flavobacterium oncorhynchi]OXA95981.1 hypothetical protein B0A75_18115 [Flavobacterium oncorhynchi]
MYTLYYLNRNLQLGTIKADSLDVPILVPEDLIFCDLRKDINFIKEPHKCIDFTDIERLIIQSQFNDVSLIKEGDYRKQNTYLNPLCQIDINARLVLSQMFTSWCEWSYPAGVQVYWSTTENGTYTLIPAFTPIQRFYNRADIPADTRYWVKLYDPERELFSNALEHYPAE